MSAQVDPHGYVEPIRLSAVVKRDPASAFALFTRDMTSWWPMETHTFSPGRPHTLVMEEHAGGRFYERREDGSEYTIGQVLAWDPPTSVVYTWTHADWVAPTEVEVRFTPVDTGLTRVDVEHRGWERLGMLALENRNSYVNGWPGVFARYTAAAGAA